jgi:hypothetical protein
MRRMDDEGYDLDAKWHEIERLDLDIHRQIRVLMMERQKRT